MEPRDLPPDLVERLAKAFAAAIVKAIRDDAAPPVQTAAALTKPTDRLLRPKDVLEIIPVHRSTLSAWIEKGKFPQPVKISPARIYWRETTVQAWIAKHEQRPVTPRAYLNLPRRRAKAK